MVYQIFNDGIDRRQSLSSKVASKQQQKQQVSFTSNGYVKCSKNKLILNQKEQKRSSWSLFSLLPNYLNVQTDSRLATLLIILIKILLFLYDLISLPIYFLIQRPDKQSSAEQRIHSNQVDANTWIRMHKQRHPILLRFCKQRKNVNNNLFVRKNANNFDDDDKDDHQNNCCPVKTKFMGSTLSEIFAKSIEDYGGKACLGYRAVVTCPVMKLNEEGKHVMEEKSFRSDYTWYTYGQIGQRVQDIASGLYHTNIYPQSRALFLASTSLEWFCTAQACFQLTIQLVLAPPEINDCKILKLILEETCVECLFVSCDKLEKLCQLIDLFEHKNSNCNSTLGVCKCFALKRIIIIDWPFTIDFNDETFHQLGECLNDLHNQKSNPIASLAAKNSVEKQKRKEIIQVLSIGQVEECGIENPIELKCSRSLNNDSLDQLLTLNNCLPTTKLIKTQQQQQQHSNDINYDNKIESTNKFTIQLSPLIQRRKSSSSSSSSSSSTTIRGGHYDGETYSSTLANRDGELLPQAVAARPKDLAIISYTFASLGQLKAIILTHSQLARCTNHLFLDGMICGDDVHCSVMQLDNLLEFMIELCVFSHGGSIGYGSSNYLNTLFYDGKELFARDKSDLEALNPSFLVVRPYILERLRSSLQNYLQFQLNPLIGFIMKNALYDYKKYWAQHYYRTPIVDRLFCSQLRNLFGTRVNYILCNGSTDCSETKDFFAFMLDLPIVELYGPDEAIVSLISINEIWDNHKRREGCQRAATVKRAVSGYGWRLFQFDQYEDNEDNEESDALSLIKNESSSINCLLPPRNNTNIYRQDFSKNILFTSSILCPTYGTRIKIEDWEDFRLSDQPYPRGRLVIGGELVCQAYLKSPTISLGNSSALYRDGNSINWFRTGDIARVFPNGSFEIISAICNLIKMVDGQFVSLSQIEYILRNSRFVDNVCAICGDDRSFVINLIVPNLRRLALKSPGEANLKQAIAMQPEPDELIDVEFRREVCNDRLLCEFVTEHLNELLANSGLATIQNRFLLVPEIWTPESELVTPAFEPKRTAIQKFYATDIQSIVKTMQFRHNSRRLLAKRYKTRKLSSPPSL